MRVLHLVLPIAYRRDGKAENSRVATPKKNLHLTIGAGFPAAPRHRNTRDLPRGHDKLRRFVRAQNFVTMVVACQRCVGAIGPFAAGGIIFGHRARPFGVLDRRVHHGPAGLAKVSTAA